MTVGDVGRGVLYNRWPVRKIALPRDVVLCELLERIKVQRNRTMKGLTKGLGSAVCLASFTCADSAARIFVATEVLAPEPNETSSVSEGVTNKVHPSDALVARKGAMACMNSSSVQHLSTVAVSHEAV